MAIDDNITKTAAASVPATPAVGQLSFTGRRPDDGINLWSPADVAGDWGEQCRIGREYGREAVDYIRGTDDATLLPGIVRTIAERGTFSGVELGFFTAVSMSLLD